MRLEGAEEVHRVWSPLSGQVVAVNAELNDSAELIDSDPFGAGWLVRIAPAAVEDELDLLTIRSIRAVAAEGG